MVLQFVLTLAAFPQTPMGGPLPETGASVSYTLCPDSKHANSGLARQFKTQSELAPFSCSQCCEGVLAATTNLTGRLY